MKNYINYINENINWDQELINSSRKGDLKGVKQALEQEADVHVGNDLSLLAASAIGNLPVVKYLVEQGADVHSKNDKSLRVASQEYHLPVVKYLVSVYEERRKFRELVSVFDKIPKQVQQELKEKYPWLFAAFDQNLI